MSFVPNDEVENTPLYHEVIDVLVKCDHNTQAYWTVTFILNDNGDIYEPMQLTQLSIVRDYMGGYVDMVGISALIPAGKYAERIYKNRNTLSAILTRTPLLERSTTVDTTKPVMSVEFTAILKENKGTDRQLNGDEIKDERAMDLKMLIDAEFQLFSKVAEQVRITTVGGIYRNCTVEELMRYIITDTTGKYKIDSTKKLAGVDIVPTHNPVKQPQVVIPHGVHLYDLPGFMQKTYGVYNAGLGSFIQGKHWYIFSLFDTNRFFKTKKTFTLYLLPKRKFPEIERTYRILGDDISIICTTTTEFKADTNLSQMINGNASRFTDASKVMSGFGKTKGNRFVTDRKANNFEIKTDKSEVKFDYTPVHENRITSNPFQAYTDMALSKGGIFTVLWENSSPNILTPGMPCRIVYYDRDVIKEGYGVLVSANHIVQKVGDFNMRKHTTNSRLRIFANLKFDKQ